MLAKVLDKIYGVVYNIGNHKGYNFQSFHTEKRNPRKLQLSGISFGIMSDLLSVDPLAYVVTNYACQTESKKDIMKFKPFHLLPIGRNRHNYIIPCFFTEIKHIFTKSGRVGCRLRTLWKFHKYFDFCHTIVTKRT